jgi:hypothetical protein
MPDRRVGVRWTIGDVSAPGFEALRLSIWGAYKLFGPDADYAVTVNTIGVDAAQERTGEVPSQVTWQEAGKPPASLQPLLDGGMAEGVAWKLAPVRLFPDRYELSLDNDCIVWERPQAMRDWLEEREPRCLIAADDILAHGAFTHLTRPEPRNTGIRGLPPGYDLEATLRSVLEQFSAPLQSELDEQGLQVTAMDLPRPAHVVAVNDVSICSPFWPHRPALGRCGAHFVGLNARELPFEYYGRPASACVRENWTTHLPELTRRVGVEPC